MTAKLKVNSQKGSTGYVHGIVQEEDVDLGKEEEEDTFVVRGKIDRLDYVSTIDHDDDESKSKGGGGGSIRIIDYKSGKAPNFKYTPETNERIANDAMFQLKLYALVLHEMLNNHQDKPSKTTNLLRQYNISKEDIRHLRLMYLRTATSTSSGQILDMDLGSTPYERDVVLQDVHMEVSSLWKEIRTLVESGDPMAFRHCDKEWCSCHVYRKRFLPGTVWCRTMEEEEDGRRKRKRIEAWVNKNRQWWGLCVCVYALKDDGGNEDFKNSSLTSIL